METREAQGRTPGYARLTIERMDGTREVWATANQPAASLETEAAAFVEHYTKGGGCGNCGGLPHTTTCFVGRIAKALSTSCCAGCGGRGEIGDYEQIDYGVWTGSKVTSRQCPDCGGSGREANRG